MKEKYFNENKLVPKSQEYLNSFTGKKKLKIAVPDWNNTCLLILDMQKYFLNSSSHAFVPSSPYIVSNMVVLANLFRKNNLPVICTRHINNDDYTGMMTNWWQELIVENNELSSLIPEIHNIDASVIRKHEYDAFFETSLEETLKLRGIKNLIVTGVMTHLCVETTVRSAFVRGFQPYLPVNGTATYHEGFHKASLLNLSHGFAIITTMEILIDSLKE